ncbi:DUF4417 domain-containing protein [Anaerovorax sp. IOR16]|uniref:DUF4417 domain-containing protein n=1 Tax=Anaerovorax sp. IOR16 TaxID=2773458 RepID=UPI0019D1CDB0|nr:DUF4417 domain-containing protein [Anaerovorax sp. IOR16]
MSLCERDCSRCVWQLHCQGCSLCEIIFCRKYCHRCFSLCPKRRATFALLQSIKGGELSLAGNNSKCLPFNIPILPDHLTEPMNLGEIIGIHGGNFLTSNGENVARVYRRKGIKEALNLSNDPKSVLQFYVKDRTIEGLWDNRKELYKQLLEFSWVAVIAPNFSVYEDAPRMDHLYNIKRSSIVYNEMLEAGLPAVPDISWYNRIDLDQWIREIRRNHIKTIAFSFQTVSTQSKASNTWRHYLMGFAYLVSQLDDDVEVIIAGLVSPGRLQMLRTAGNGKNRISVLNQTAYIQSRRGILSEKPTESAGELTKNQILIRNIDFYTQEYETMNLGGSNYAKVEK